MKFIAILLRLWSCVFAIGTGIFLTLLALLIIGANIKNLDMSMLPWWKGSTLTIWLVFLGLLGISAGALALAKRVKLLLTLYTLAAFAIIVYGFFINMGHSFYGKAGFHNAGHFALAALIAFLGSLTQFGKPRRS